METGIFTRRQKRCLETIKTLKMMEKMQCRAIKNDLFFPLFAEFNVEETMFLQIMASYGPQDTCIDLAEPLWREDHHELIL